jgi:hypothetical protein
MTSQFKISIFILALFAGVSGFSQDKNVQAQFGVFPGLSTNGDSARKVTNNLSFNLFAGHQGGLQGFELAVAANILDSNAQGMQVSGITNIVKGDVTALQVAGIANIVGKDFQGIQASGITNIVSGEFQGMQVGGIFNSTKTLYGAQITGISGKADDIYGLQVNGLGGYSKSITGLQVSGFINQSKSVKGAQIAGFVNVTEDLQGVQIGFINISKRVKGGVPIGFISFSKYGYKTIDVSTNEIFPATLSLKTGVDEFYNIFTAASNFEYDNHLWSVGYGLGSRFHMTQSTLLEFEVMASHLSQNQLAEEVNALGRFNMNFAFQLGSVGEIYFGPSLNVYATQIYNRDTETFGYDIAPKNSFYKEVFYDLDKPTYVEAWIGGQIGIRL